MKTFSKVLSMFLVVVMCFGLFATSAYASENFDFGNENSGSFAAADSFTASDSFDFGGPSSIAAADTFNAPAAAAEAESFVLAQEAEETPEETARHAWMEGYEAMTQADRAAKAAKQEAPQA